MIFKEILKDSVKVIASRQLSDIFTAIFYENVNFDSYLQLVIVPADNLLDEFRENTVILFVEAEYSRDIAFINLPLLKTKPGIDVQSTAVFPVMTTVSQNEDGSELLVTEPLINMILIDGLSNNINLQSINFDLYVRKMDYVHQSNTGETNGLIIHNLDTNKEYESALQNSNEDAP